MAKIELTPEYIGSQILAYCQKHLIPLEYFFRIIYDQKVVPMLRGKGMEYSAYLVLRDILDEQEWSVQKLNLAAQANIPDQDITVTHRRTGIRLKFESKSAVRESFTLGKRTKKLKNIPHFNVKSHRSRSNISKRKKGNDRYLASDFDVILSNPENAIYQGNTASEGFELLHDEEAVKFLMKFYKVNTPDKLPHAAYSDWRFVLPPDIAEGGFIPRTPYVKLENDPHWHSLNQLEAKLTDLVQRRRPQKTRSSK